MLLLRIVKLLLAVFTLQATCQEQSSIVTWDEHSLLINGERVFIFSGEFHYERLPVPELWRDVLEKYKANGLNAVSVYFFWSYHSARQYDIDFREIPLITAAGQGEFDFTSPGKDIQRLLDIAKEVGLYVIARPGPYCNAETNGGGLALWGSDGSLGSIRTSDETYHQAWLPWMNAVNEILAKNQIDHGGPIILYQIENELQETIHEANNTLVLYMEQIEEATRDASIIVPFTSNEKGMRSQSWSTDYQDVGGAVDIYGLDSYPGGLSCTNINSGFNLVRTYYQWFQNYSYTQPESMPEFEAGWFSAWGSDFYDQCIAEHDPAFADVYYKNNIGQRVTLQNLYMAFGGTNWGNLAAPVVYTSYDYSAPLRETREVQLKFKQTKLVGLFARVSQDLRKTVMESNGTGNAASSADVFSWVLRNPDNRAGFYTFQHNTSSSRAVTTFEAHLNTSQGNVTVANVQLNGRQSKIVTTDYHFGNHTLLYSSADVLSWGTFGDIDVLVMYADIGQISEFAWKTSAGNTTYQSCGTAELSTTASNSSAFTSYSYTQTSGCTVVVFENGVTIYLLDTETAWNFFAPPLSSDPIVRPEQQIFILGPYNVRSASVGADTVNLIGDNANATTIEVYAAAGAASVIWNGKTLDTERTAYGALRANIPGAEGRAIDLPELSWMTADSLPEARPDYDDSKWIVCNHTSTKSPVAPLTLPVLFSSDYGYYAGVKIYRGFFDGNATSVNITVQGGLAAGFSAWLNGQLVGHNAGNASATRVSSLLDFSNATLSNSSNVLTVVTDYTGHDQTSTGPAGVENPRGIMGADLYNGNSTANFTQWKIQGNAGGNSNIDPVRGPLNEDGLYGTRIGWHLPGFDTSGAAWSNGSPLTGLNKSGINWYISMFELNLDQDLDVPLGIELNAPEGTIASVQLYMNGYQYGKYIPQIGPQTRFPFPPGVVNNRGTNTLALALWAQTDAGARLSNATLFAYGQYQTGFNFNQDWSELQPGWTEERLQYA